MDTKLQKLLNHGRVVVSVNWMEENLGKDWMSDVRTCYNAKRLGMHDTYVAWMFDDAKPVDLKFHPQGHATGSL